MSRIHLPICAVILLAATTLAHASTVTIPTDPSAPNSNFGSPTATANAGYTISVSDASGSLTVLLHGLSGAGVTGEFANFYFDTTASTPNTGSNLGFEFGQGYGDAFIPGGAGGYALTAGFSETFTNDADGGYDATIVIPNSFFIDDPDGMGFTTAADGSLVSLHLSQSFSYTVAGGSANFPAPDELGAAVLTNAPAATPEPSSLALLGTGVLSAAGMIRRRLKK